MRTNFYFYIIWWALLLSWCKDFHDRVVIVGMMIAHVVFISLNEALKFMEYIKKRDQDLHWKKEEEKLHLLQRQADERRRAKLNNLGNLDGINPDYKF